MAEITNDEARGRAVERCRERGVLIPTFAQMREPASIDPVVRSKLAGVGMQDLDPLNLFRITWRNDPETGGFGEVNAVEFPPELTGVPARIVGLVGKHFPTGSHKVGAAFGCLVPRLVTGEFDPTTQQGSVAVHGQLLQGRGLRQCPVGLPARGDSPRGNEPGAIRVAPGDRCRGHRHPGMREQCQRDLRQVLGDPRGPGPRP